MVCYFKKKAYRQQLEKNLFDWTCFLNNIYSCSFGKKNKMISYTRNKAKGSGILNTVYQKKKKEKSIKNLENINLTNKINKHIYKIPFFVLNNSLKKNFMSLGYMIKNVKNIFTFISLNTKESKILRCNKICSSENKNTLVSYASKIFFTLHGVHFGCRFFEKTNKICLFKKQLIPLKMTYEILFEYYKHLSGFALKKNAILYNFKFVPHYTIESCGIFNTRIILVKKNYEFRKENFVSIENKLNRHRKVYYGYCDFFKKNHNIHNKLTWVFSKNIKLPFFSFTENLVLYINAFQHSYLTISKYVNLEFSFFNKKKTITHIFSTKKATYSLICIPIKLSWIFDIINNYSMLPTCLSWTKNKKKINTNPFYLKFSKKKDKKINNFYFRQKYTKKRIFEKELYHDTIIWFTEINLFSLTNGNLVTKKKNNYIGIMIFRNQV